MSKIYPWNTIALYLYFWISKVLLLYLKSKRIKKKKK